MLKTKIISSLDKCFLDSSFEEFAEITHVNIYKNTNAAFQLLPYDDEEVSDTARVHYKVRLEGDIADKAVLRTVENIPNYIPFPQSPKRAKELDPTYIRTTAGLYPDVLVPIQHGDWFSVIKGQLRSLWIDVINDGISSGEHELKVQLCDMEGNAVSENEVVIKVIDASLPEQDTRVTQWFYADCVADYYDLEVWSDKHFEYCRRVIKTAVDNGINMIYVPLLTPALDTAVGGERTTTQLVGVTVENGKYSFDLSLLDRYIDMLLDCGVKYFEMCHLFTQWGAYHAAKVMATVDGEYKRIFGWDTDAAGEEYVTFLKAMLTEVTAYLDKKGLRDRTYFHISDEPGSEHLEQYKKNKENLKSVIGGWKLLDALSHVDFYKEGLVEIPVPISNSIESFMPEDIKERWIYYCCGPSVGYSNRFMGMHSARTRFMGMQMYKYGIEGFLHWGLNFYNNQYSHDHIDPFLNGNAGFWAGGGDAVSIYPGRHGMPLESLRLIAFAQGIEDIRALKLCEQYYSKEEIVARLEELFGETITFKKCVNDTETMEKMRAAIDQMIMEKI